MKKGRNKVRVILHRGYGKVNHPSHYGGDVPHEAIKCINAWNLNFNLGNAAKYICRAGKKNGESKLDDLQKAVFYLNWEIAKLRGYKV